MARSCQEGVGGIFENCLDTFFHNMVGIYMPTHSGDRDHGQIVDVIAMEGDGAMPIFSYYQLELGVVCVWDLDKAEST
jgi:hypothetical protein